MKNHILILQQKAIKDSNVWPKESDIHNSNWTLGSLKRLDKAILEAIL